MDKNKVFMYVSSWAEHGGAPGLGLFLADLKSGAITFLEEINNKESFNGSCIDTGKKKLYVNNEVPVYEGAPCASGRIFIYDLDPETGKAREAGRVSTRCPNPAYLSLDPGGNYLFEAHHSCEAAVARYVRNEQGQLEAVYTCAEAAVQVYERDEAGMPGLLVDDIDHLSYGDGAEAHPHCVVFSPSGKLIAVADKGTGFLYLYAFDYEKKRLRLLNKMLTDKAGAAPRYVLFHPVKPFLFVNHEASYDGKCYVTCFRYQEDGELERICVVNALDQSLPVKIGTRLEQQGFVMEPGGKYLYTLINAADVIAVLEVDERSGELKLLQNIPVPGKRPRGLAIFPNGKFLVASCLVGGELISFKIEKDGRLSMACKGPSQPGASYMSFYAPQ